MKNIVLIGLSGSGKTTLGCAAAQQLGLGFFDMDGEIEKGENALIPEIFEKHGEEYFRRLETRAAAKAALCRRTIISTGGGVVLRSENMQALREGGFVIFIDRPAALIAKDVDCGGRPLLADGAERIFALERERRVLYLKYADASIVNDGDMDEAFEKLAALIRSKYPGDAYAVIGDPIVHSLSPEIHNAVFARLGRLYFSSRASERGLGYAFVEGEAPAGGRGYAFVEGEASADGLGYAFVEGEAPAGDRGTGSRASECLQYHKIHVPAGRLGEFITAARNSGLKGFNVTIPHKRDIIAYLDDIDRDAELCGAVNTVLVRDGRFIGYNTDMGGLLFALERRGKAYAGRRVTVIGAGGAAAGVILKAAMEGAKKVTVLSRRIEAAEDIARRAREAAAAARNSAGDATRNVIAVEALELTEGNLEKAAKGADIIINATPLGMKGFKEDFRSFGFLKAMPASGLVCDLIYNPAETALLAAANALGLETLNGLGMLIYQALLADELFLEREINKAEMFEMINNTNIGKLRK
ncbi:MAG: hypothetical protein LBL49_04035 [Clostridiales Family XIII bacterium]|jgi:shikimate dehydrogenase|nr:hypothetical protein [Clostridiales Family XIII bacterium]